MARVVVVGGGFGGMAAAARLAKLGHEVALLERSQQLGGALGTVSRDGFTWNTGPTQFVMPAVLRDLFRKSGRPLEAELGAELEPLPVIREHRFEDETALSLPGGSRAAHKAAFEELGPGLGDAWAAYVDSHGVDWEVLRKHYFEVPWERDSLPREVRARFDNRESMHKHLRRTFRDERLALIAGHSFVHEGHDLRNVPVWCGLISYLEETFGAWTVPASAGGMPGLLAALEKRLATREVIVATGVEAQDLVISEGRVVAVSTAQGDYRCDVVVCAVDPRRLPALARYVDRTMPAIPPLITHLGLAGDVPELPGEVVLHGDPTIIVRPGGTAPEGHTAWTLHGRGKVAEDMVTAIARRGIKVRDHVVSRVDLSPYDLVVEWGGSPMGVLWQGRTTVRDRLGPTTPIPGVYAAGAHATPGGSIPFVGLSAAQVAQAIGPAA